MLHCATPNKPQLQCKNSLLFVLGMPAPKNVLFALQIDPELWFFIHFSAKEHILQGGMT